MEEKHSSTKNRYRVVVTGPESTGKTDLTMQLARHFKGLYIPEYARFYVESLNRQYNYNDVVYIAQKQLELDEKYTHKQPEWLFFDTYLIITKVWFEYVFKKCPPWLIKKIETASIDIFLLCNNDIPWEKDSVRENGGEMREQLLEEYRKQLEYFGFKYWEVKGTGVIRTENAIQIIKNELL